MKFIARYSNHIQDDIKRGWSSWNFGQDGLEASEEQIEAWKQEAIDNNEPFYISGFELWGDDIENADIRELYPGYWVLVDNENGIGEGIFGAPLSAETIENAIEEAKKADYSGEGVKFNPSDYELVYSINDEIHIFKLK